MFPLRFIRNFICIIKSLWLAWSHMTSLPTQRYLPHWPKCSRMYIIKWSMVFFFFSFLNLFKILSHPINWYLLSKMQPNGTKTVPLTSNAARVSGFPLFRHSLPPCTLRAGQPETNSLLHLLLARKSSCSHGKLTSPAESIEAVAPQSRVTVKSQAENKNKKEITAEEDV